MGIPLSFLSALLQTLIASSCKLDRESGGRKKEKKQKKTGWFLWGSMYFPISANVYEY